MLKNILPGLFLAAAVSFGAAANDEKVDHAALEAACKLEIENAKQNKADPKEISKAEEELKNKKFGACLEALKSTVK